MTNALTDEQQGHLDSIVEVLVPSLSAKYTKGAIEHGGNLWEATPLDLINMGIEEAIDQIVYLVTLKQALAHE